MRWLSRSAIQRCPAWTRTAAGLLSWLSAAALLARARRRGRRGPPGRSRPPGARSCRPRRRCRPAPRRRRAACGGAPSIFSVPRPRRRRPRPDEVRAGVGDQQRAVGSEGDVHRVGERSLLGAGHRLHAPLPDPPDAGVADVGDDERGVAVEERGVRRAEARLRGRPVGLALLARGAGQGRDGVPRRAAGRSAPGSAGESCGSRPRRPR